MDARESPPTTTPRNALVVDDHPLVAKGVAGFLLSHCGFARSVTASSAADCLREIGQGEPPALAVIDFWLPDGAALDLLRELRRRCPATRLLAVSGDSSPEVLARVRESGAHGFLHKHEQPEVFARAVAALLAGADWFEGAAPPAAATPPSLPLRARDFGLTDRQAEVLGMILRGLPNKRIASALGVSEQTVKEHVTHVLARLGVSNRIEAIGLLHGRRFES